MVAHADGFFGGLTPLKRGSARCSGEQIIPPGDLNEALCPELACRPFPGIVSCREIHVTHESLVIQAVRDMIARGSARGTYTEFRAESMLSWSHNQYPETRAMYWYGMHTAMRAAQLISDAENIGEVTGWFLHGLDVDNYDFMWGKKVFHQWLRFAFDKGAETIMPALERCTHAPDAKRVLLGNLMEHERRKTTVTAETHCLDWVGIPDVLTRAFLDEYPHEHMLWKYATSFCSGTWREIFQDGSSDVVTATAQFLWLPCLFCISFAAMARREVLDESTRYNFCGANVWISFAYELAVCWRWAMRASDVQPDSVARYGGPLDAVMSVCRWWSVSACVTGVRIPDEDEAHKEKREQATMVLWVAGPHQWTRNPDAMID